MSHISVGLGAGVVKAFPQVGPKALSHVAGGGACVALANLLLHPGILQMNWVALEHPLA